jgi:sugar phosphate isomerase/epimerase
LLDGECNYPAVMRELRALGYDGYLTSEVSAAERGPGGSIAETAVRLQQIITL